MFNLGQKIKKRRGEAGLSLKKLGDACGISDTEVMKIENGDRKNPNWVTICEISKTLKFHPFELLLDAGYITAQDIHPNSQIHGLEKLNKEEIKTVQAFIDFMAEHKANDVFSKRTKRSNENEF
jgi:transcriptional regulator with XRE-family HTH domain